MDRDETLPSRWTMGFDENCFSIGRISLIRRIGPIRPMRPIRPEFDTRFCRGRREWSGKLLCARCRGVTIDGTRFFHRRYVKSCVPTVPCVPNLATCVPTVPNISNMCANCAKSDDMCAKFWSHNDPAIPQGFPASIPCVLRSSPISRME